MDSSINSDVSYQFTERMLQDSAEEVKLNDLPLTDYQDGTVYIYEDNSNTVLENTGQFSGKMEEDLIEKAYLLLVEGTSRTQDSAREVITFATIDDNLEEISEFDEHINETIFNQSESISLLDAISTSSKDDDDDNRNEDDGTYEMILKDNTYYYKCKLCSYDTVKKYLLRSHQKTHSDDRPHVCLICDRSFKWALSLKAHINIHKRHKPHCCSYCELRFHTSSELVRHKRYKHTLEKPYKCDICDYRCVERSKLHRHMRGHTGERPYQCPHCTYASQDSFRLKRHIRKHTGEKPYMCDICEKRFTQSNSVTLHRKLHYATTSFQCQHCMTTFTRLSCLQHHIQLQHTPGEPKMCPKCHKVFLDIYSFKTHMKTHAGRKLAHERNKNPYKCKKCNLIFRRKQLLRHHERFLCTARGVNKKVFICNECGQQFSYKTCFIRHIIKHGEHKT